MFVKMIKRFILLFAVFCVIDNMGDMMTSDNIETVIAEVVLIVIFLIVSAVYTIVEHDLNKLNRNR